MNCMFCHYWTMGVPCGHCTHPDTFYMSTSDDMVFRGAGEDCPLTKEEQKEN